jgi:hypothetical protein
MFNNLCFKKESLNDSLSVDANPVVVLRSKAIRTNHLVKHNNYE